MKPIPKCHSFQPEQFPSGQGEANSPDVNTAQSVFAQGQMFHQSETASVLPDSIEGLRAKARERRQFLDQIAFRTVEFSEEPSSESVVEINHANFPPKRHFSRLRQFLDLDIARVSLSAGMVLVVVLLTLIFLKMQRENQMSSAQTTEQKAVIPEKGAVASKNSIDLAEEEASMERIRLTLEHGQAVQDRSLSNQDFIFGDNSQILNQGWQTQVSPSLSFEIGSF